MRLNLRAVNFRRFPIQDIDHPSRTIPFDLNPPQQFAVQQFIELQDRNRPIWTIDLKARRVGFSTLYAILNAIHCIAFPNAMALTVAHRAKNAKAVFQAARGAHRAILEDFGVPYSDYRTQHELRFPHAAGESLLSLATAKTVEGARGMTLTALQLSEAAFYEQAEDAFTALLNTVAHQPQTLLNIESTANGKVGPGETFYQHWLDAVAGRNDFLPIFIAWFTDPRYQMDPERMDVKMTNLDQEEKDLIRYHKVTYAQLSWRRWAIPNLCQGYVDKFHQEFPSCLVAETRVSTQRGIISIADALPGDITESGVVSAMLPQGKAETFKAVTKAGRVIVGTDDHPLLTVDGEFVGLAQSLGRKIVLRPPRFADDQFVVKWRGACRTETILPIDADFARFLGYFMGDSSYNYGNGAGATVSIACTGKDEDVVADVERLFDRFFGRHHTRTIGNKRGCSEVRVGCREFRTIMDRLDIYRANANTPHRRICVPEAIYRSPRPIVREFLRGLFEADGLGQDRITLFSERIEFLRSIQLLLLGFGITSAVRERPSHTNGYVYVARTLDLKASESLLFNQEIGFVSERKRSRSGTATPDMGRHRTPIIFEDEIIHIEPAGIAEVFDLAIDDYQHTFSANGIVVHNTPEEAFITTGDPAFNADEMKIAESTAAKRKPIFYGDIENLEELA